MHNDIFYDTPEEKRAIQIENQVAKELGLPQRYTHQGSKSGQHEVHQYLAKLILEQAD